MRPCPASRHGNTDGPVRGHDIRLHDVYMCPRGHVLMGYFYGAKQLLQFKITGPENNAKMKMFDKDNILNEDFMRKDFSEILFCLF